ncbi:MAG: HAD family hydrolase [Clostridia bacterium]|nr:HAD family hydrolase [Clostridia bacterium]
MKLQADAIIFDKDGTLLDFDAYWVAVSEKALNKLLSALGRADIPLEELLAALGVQDGVTDFDSVLCKGTYEEMGGVVHEVLVRHGCTLPRAETDRMVLDYYTEFKEAGVFRPTCVGLKEALVALKERGIRLAVVTTDTVEIARYCLERLGILELFDAVYGDDGKTPAKPDPYAAEALCAAFGIGKERVVMVGDTMTDLRFARNAGIQAVSVAKEARQRAFLQPHADLVIREIAELPALVN